MSPEKQNITSVESSVATAPAGCDLADYLNQGVGTLEEVATLARETANTLDTPLSAQTTAEMAVSLAGVNYPKTQRDSLKNKIEENTRRTIDGALAGAYIVQNCTECPVAPDCDLLEALRAQADEGLEAKAQNDALSIAVNARRLAIDLKTPFTTLLSAQERVNDPQSPHARSDIMRANDITRSGLNRILVDPSNKPYRNEAVVALRQLLKQGSKGGSLLQRAEAADMFSAFTGIAAEVFISDAISNSTLVTEQAPATRAEDVREGTDFFAGFTDDSGVQQRVRIDAKSAGKFSRLKQLGDIKKLAVGDDTGHFGIKTITIRNKDGSTRTDEVLVICPTGNNDDMLSGYNDHILKRTGCVDLEQTPTKEFTELIDSALREFVQQRAA